MELDDKNSPPVTGALPAALVKSFERGRICWPERPAPIGTLLLYGLGEREVEALWNANRHILRRFGVMELLSHDQILGHYEAHIDARAGIFRSRLNDARYEGTTDQTPETLDPMPPGRAPISTLFPPRLLLNANVETGSILLRGYDARPLLTLDECREVLAALERTLALIRLRRQLIFTQQLRYALLNDARPWNAILQEERLIGVGLFEQKHQETFEFLVELTQRFGAIPEKDRKRGTLRSLVRKIYREEESKDIIVLRNSIERRVRAKGIAQAMSENEVKLMVSRELKNTIAANAKSRSETMFATIWRILKTVSKEHKIDQGASRLSDSQQVEMIQIYLKGVSLFTSSVAATG